MSQFWALSMWLCRGGVKKIQTARSRSLWWKKSRLPLQTSAARKRGNMTRSFMDLFISFLAYFIENNFFLQHNWIQCAFCTGKLRQRWQCWPCKGRSQCCQPAFFCAHGRRRTACLQPGLRLFLVPSLREMPVHVTRSGACAIRVIEWGATR